MNVMYQRDYEDDSNSRFYNIVSFVIILLTGRMLKGVAVTEEECSFGMNI